MKETFKDIKGYEGLYQASNLGRIKSFNYGEETLLNPPISKTSGYRVLRLYNKGKGRTISVHQAVAMAFLNHTPDGYNMTVDHIDNNPLNNCLSNLQLMTQRENKNRIVRGVSKYAGVYFRKDTKKWRSVICIKGKRKSLGSFKTEEEAHETYQTVLKQLG